MSFIRLKTADGSELILPAVQPVFTGLRNQAVGPLITPISVRKNKLITKRISDNAKSRLAQVKSFPYAAAIAVSRLSASQHVTLNGGTTPDTPDTPDEPRSCVDLLRLSGTKRRERIVKFAEPVQQEASIVMLQPGNTGRLHSIKSVS